MREATQSRAVRSDEMSSVLGKGPQRAITHSDSVRLQIVSVLVIRVRAEQRPFLLTLIVQTLKQNTDLLQTSAEIVRKCNQLTRRRSLT